MTLWLDPQGVAGVLQRTNDHAGRFEGQLTEISDALSTAARNGSSQLVADALTAWSESSSPAIETAMSRTGSMLTAAVEATTEYVDADARMHSDVYWQA